MDEIAFEAALATRIDNMLDACTRCGECVKACPSVEPAGLSAVSSTAIITGVIDILRHGDGSEQSKKWASSCTLSGDCITACREGVNPRFLLAMARASNLKTATGSAERRRRGVQNFRDLSRDVSVLSRLQLNDELLKRLGQGTQAAATFENEPDFMFYTGCNVLKTPHIALLALDLMDRLGISYRVMGGPSHCCGVQQLRAGDLEMTGRVAANTMDRLSQSKTKNVLSWCPSCYVQFTETALPAFEQQHGTLPFEMTPFIKFLAGRLDDLTPLLTQRVDIRVALHRHPGVAGAMEAAERILRTVPGVILIDLGQPAVGLQSVSLSALPAHKRRLQLAELTAARDKGVEALVTVYHSDHRELCAHERNCPFKILNILEIVGLSAGLERVDRYKQLKLMQNVDLIIDECGDLIKENRIDPLAAREVVTKALLGDQPLPLVATDEAPR